MIAFPQREQIGQFLLLGLGPAIGLPLLAMGLGAVGGGPLTFVLLIIYVFPPLLIAHAIGITSRSSTVYSSLLFEGYIGIGPTPLGFVFCTVVWILISYVVWFLFVGLRCSPAPVSRRKLEEPKKWDPEQY